MKKNCWSITIEFRSIKGIPAEKWKEIFQKSLTGMFISVVLIQYFFLWGRSAAKKSMLEVNTVLLDVTDAVGFNENL